MNLNRHKFFISLVFIVVLSMFFITGLVVQAVEDDEVLKINSEGDRVANVQQRLKDLGYFNYKVTGSYGSVTREAVSEFQKNHYMNVDGVVGADTESILFSNDAKMRPIDDSLNKINIPVSRGGRASAGRLVDWFNGGNSMFPRGTTALVTDVNTGISFTVRRMGGSNHADVEPLTKEDTNKLFELYGRQWSWTRRAVIVNVGGESIAASIHGMPHASSTISNNGMNGHICIHFYKSLTHGNNRLDPQHQAMVMKASGR